MMQPKKQAEITIFYSYASVDSTWRDKLSIHLSQLRNDGLIKESYDQQILPGLDRLESISQAINSAHIILLLISAEFLASHSCYHVEMEQALKRHKRGEVRVIPILVSPCDWSGSPFEHLQCLPRNGKPITVWDNLDEAFVAIARELRRIIAKRQFPNPPLSVLQRRNRTRLLKRVHGDWIERYLEVSLQKTAWIKLYLQGQLDAIENPWRSVIPQPDHAPSPVPIDTGFVELHEVYDEADGELLILGEPGAGKTTLLLVLARTLLQRAEQDELLRIPVVFPLSSWAVKRLPLEAWLVEELSTKYQVPREVARVWIATDQILPLLDGLDEVAKGAQSACVQAINAYNQSRLEKSGESPIVVCCRREEYDTLSPRFTFQHAVSILPLTDVQIDTYLEQVGEQVKGLRQALNNDPKLYDLVRQPLMLSILIFAYEGATAVEVPTGATSEAIQHAIFATYVEHMLKRPRRSKHWKSKRVTRYLNFLAKQIQRSDQTVFSVEDLEEGQAIQLAMRSRILYLWGVGLSVGLVLGRASGRVFGQVFGQSVEWLVGRTFGLIFGLVGWLTFGLIGMLVSVLNIRISLADGLIWSWKDARLYFVRGVVIGVVMGGVVMGLVIVPFHALIAGMVVVPVVGVVSVLVWGLFSGLSTGLLGGLLSRQFGSLLGRQLPKHPFPFPRGSIWHFGKIGLIFGLLTGLSIGVIVGLIAGPLGGLITGLAVGLITGLIAGLGVLAKHFIWRLILSLQGKLPWNLVAFLDEAAERLLLRKVGRRYIFVHRQLLDYFASLDKSRSTRSTSP
jgi:hypothetical protein